MGGSDTSDRALAALLLLPAALLLWPTAPGPLLGVFDAVEATGAGAGVLAALPAAGLAAWRGWRRPASPPRAVLAFWLAAALSAALVPASDSFGRDAALAIVATGAVLAIGAASLDEDGRLWLVRGLVALTLLALLPALVGLVGEGYAGVVGNTGELSGAALPGALVGAQLFARGRGPWRLAGLAAALALLLHAMLAPVLASLLALAAAAGLTGLIELRRPRAHSAGAGLRLVALGALVLPALGFLALSPAGRMPRTAQPLEALGEPVGRPGAGGDLGGVAVRARIWRASLGLVREQPLLGVGPGQFAATFPPHRDPLEIELSTHNRTLGAETEVEHPHSDPLLALAETGWVGGLAWLVLMVLAGAGALRALRGAELARAAAGLGALAALLASLMNAHLLANPPAGATAFPLLGLVLAARAGPRADGRARGSPGLAARLIPALAFGALLLGLGPARSLLAHGRALARLGTSARPSLADLELAVAEALEARPDSVVARALRARMAPLLGSGERASIERTRALLELRPHHVGAWIDLGALLARSAGGGDPRRGSKADPQGARRALERALELDPRHPIALENLCRLELLAGRTARGLALFDRLADTGRLESARGLRLGADLLLHGLAHEGEAVLARVDPRLADLDGERAQASALDFERRGQSHLAEALKVHAHRLWGHGHAERGDFESARRSLFQGLRLTREAVPGGAPRLRLEYAAALLLSGKGEEAPSWLEGLEPTPEDWSALPAWAREALTAAGHAR